MIDFNDAQPQRGDFEVIPAGTVVRGVLTIRPGNAGQGGWATESKTSDAEYLSCEFTVSEGPYINRKIWQNLTVKGGKVNEKGESIAWNITKSNIRAMLNSARGFASDDDSEAARKARVIASWGDLNGIEFVCKLKVEQAKDGYPAKNQLGQIIEPGHKDYFPSGSGGAQAQPAAQPAPAPAWAQGKPAQVQAQASNLPAWAR